MALFKAYDIRGVVPEELDADKAHGIGRAIAAHLGSGPIAVGRDARVHSPELASALIEGLRDEGVDVIDLGLVATPMLYFAVEHLSAHGGVMVTASHNPGEYNGFKICRAHAIPVGEASGLKEIEALVSARIAAAPSASRGALRSENVTGAYAAHALSVGEHRPRLKVAIDCGNGMASVGLGPVLDALSLDVVPLYF